MTGFHYAPSPEWAAKQSPRQKATTATIPQQHKHNILNRRFARLP